MTRSIYPSIRFWSKVKKTNYCWNWVATVLASGYGQFRIKDKLIYAHRFSYELSKGKIQKGLVIDHLCRNRACVNPDHLEQVTFKENILRGVGITAINAKKTHCIHGHEFTEENIYKRKGSQRECKICRVDSYNKKRKILLVVE